MKFPRIMKCCCIMWEEMNRCTSLNHEQVSHQHEIYMHKPSFNLHLRLDDSRFSMARVVKAFITVRNNASLDCAILPHMNGGND